MNWKLQSVSLLVSGSLAKYRLPDNYFLLLCRIVYGLHVIPGKIPYFTSILYSAKDQFNQIKLVLQLYWKGPSTLSRGDLFWSCNVFWLIWRANFILVSVKYELVRGIKLSFRLQFQFLDIYPWSLDLKL